MKQTKRFAVSFSHNKPQATIYLGGKEKMTADIARVILDTYKAQGYKYFTFPPLNSDDGFGKEGQVAFLKATVATRMPILLKGPDGKGCDTSTNDIEAILEGIKGDKEFNHTPKQKIEYLMRWHEQLEKYIKTTGKTELNELADKFKQQAQFTYFERSFKGVLDEEIEKGIHGELDGQKQWDDVDVIAAKHAYTKIVESIKNGHLGGKRYNPLDVEGNQKLIIEEFNRLREKQRPIIEQEIDNNIASMSNGNSNKINDPTGTAINAVRTAYNDSYIALKDDLSGNGVDITMKNRNAMVRYKPSRKSQSHIEERYQKITPKYRSIG